MLLQVIPRRPKQVEPWVVGTSTPGLGERSPPYPPELQKLVLQITGLFNTTHFGRDYGNLQTNIFMVTIFFTNFFFTFVYFIH